MDINFKKQEKPFKHQTALLSVVISVSVKVQREDVYKHLHSDLEFSTQLIATEDHTQRFGCLWHFYRCKSGH